MVGARRGNPSDVGLTLEAVAERLESWGRWAGNDGLGSRGTIEYQIFRFAGAAPKGTGQHVEEHRPEELEIDQILAAMPKTLQREKEALIARYFRGPVPMHIAASKCRCSVAGMKNRVRSGMVWVLGQIGHLP